jgi:hypothetical protein
MQNGRISNILCDFDAWPNTWYKFPLRLGVVSRINRLTISYVCQILDIIWENQLQRVHLSDKMASRTPGVLIFVVFAIDQIASQRIHI